MSQLTWTTSSSLGRQRRDTSKTCARQLRSGATTGQVCFFAAEVSYMGYIILKDGMCASDEMVQAILQYATLTDVKQLECFVGKLNYYGKFLPAFASVCTTLNQLRYKDTRWKWSTECAVAFDQLKQMLADKTRLVHFDPEKPIVLATDGSPYGIGAVISSVLPDGSEEPIAFALETLSRAERGYAQVGNEGLSIVYGIRKFNQNLSGGHFTILIDHKPLLTISLSTSSRSRCRI